eukprot:CAMPEP_0201282400 /NCGR_PEP_ID=MMETSP1317-20130820/5554_1 /ASSEMBLY_ACC=CAM_ASM_000770 /TAXON_ID=187299 /ORGANISM="Undescribed Undescribed, Strain Undescribed" /LENGTH=64 /DNA_ID=CAMNT_0047594947 /DNA_START=87 /DNA_END=281 /DNA_ORIENTATION=+
MDTDRDGRISKGELVEAYNSYFFKALEEEQLEQVLAGIDSDHSGYIDYSEFLKAAFNRRKVVDE